jgi:membrane associated rhomboid family serine protease
MPESPQHEKSLVKVIIFSTAISFGALGAVMASMKGFFHGEISFHFTIGSIVGFIVGLVVGWVFWKVVFNRRAKDETVANDVD